MVFAVNDCYRSGTESLRNPGLNEEMIHLGLLHTEPRWTDRKWCIHCDENEVEADSCFSLILILISRSM